MQELRLVGVDEDGGHLLLSGDGGATYRLPINEALRMASTRPSSRPSARPPADPQDRGDGRTIVQLSPRDIQSRIRNGATAEQIVDESGLELQHVLRYEGPVRAEREYMAHLAQRVEVSSPLPAHDGYRSAFGDNPAQLGDMVRFRLQAFGVDPDSAEWDAWRKPDGQWNVVARFELPGGSALSVGEEPPAQWTFNPTRRTIMNANRWAQVLSELEPLDGPLPSRRLSAVADRVFDFEANEEVNLEAGEPGSDNLLDVLRSRRGQRLGIDEEADDALALMLSKGHIPAAHPREGQAESDEVPEATGQTAFPGLSLAPSPEHDRAGSDIEHFESADTYDDGTPRLFEGVSTQTREVSILARPLLPDNHPVDPASRSQASARTGTNSRPKVEETPKPVRDADGGREESPDRKIRPRRSSVPSWDEIVFGAKGD
ncbi:septation protein SepH [Arthrobacter sp. H5]|uniref:septation protein SepH n=1 Tax=Arthrobacter sp. H5 TaxID=1267973 RepID=UPI00048113F7|nr:septation protein SepH [Arthrobacter sp. H5]